MTLARQYGLAVRCDYMGPRWSVRWSKLAKGWFNINPHTGSNYQFTPQQIDRESVWHVMENPPTPKDPI